MSFCYPGKALVKNTLGIKRYVFLSPMDTIIRTLFFLLQIASEAATLMSGRMT